MHIYTALCLRYAWHSAVAATGADRPAYTLVVLTIRWQLYEDLQW